MGIQPVIAVVHVILLQIQSILPLQNIILGKNFCSSLQGFITAVPALLFCIGKSVFNDRLVGAPRCLDIVIIVITLITAVGS